MLHFYNQAKVLLYIKQLEENTPVFLEIHPSMTCNHACVWCRYNRGKEQLTISQMNDILNKHPLIKGVRITGGGEPLTNPATIEFIQNCAQMKITVGLETNGELLTDKSIEIIAKHCLYCRISLDAASMLTYEKLHGSKHFEKVLDNVSRLRQSGIKELGISYLVVAENVREILDLSDLRLPVDYIHFKPIIQGISPKVRSLASITLQYWEQSHLQPKIRYDRILQDDSNNPQTRCRITKLIRLLGGNGVEYVCCEKAYQEEFEVEKWCGSTRKCLSCRYSGYNEILEQYYKNTITKELL